LQNQVVADVNFLGHEKLVGHEFEFTEMDWTNSLSTFDVVAIAKHVLNIPPLLNGYKQLAADINKNGTVTTADVTELRKLILGIYKKFPAYKQPWRFIPERVSLNPNLSIQKDFDGVLSGGVSNNDNDNPFNTIVDNIIVVGAPYTEPTWAFNMKTGTARNGFDAVKVGNVIGPIEPFLVEECPGIIPIVISNESVKSGETVELDFKGFNIQNVSAFQLGFIVANTDFKFEESSSSMLPEMNTDPSFGGLSNNENNLKIVWMSNNLNPKSIGEGNSLFKLKLKALANISNLGQALELDDSVLEGYFLDANGNCLGNSASMQIEMTKINLEGGLDDRNSNSQKFNTFENGIYCIPNPINDEATLLYDCSEAFEGQIRFHDSHGRLLSILQEHFKKGRNSILLNEIANFPSGIINASINDGRNTKVVRIIKK
jgi:hypothetical protein